MPLSLKATVTRRQPEPNNSDLSHAADDSDLNNQPAEDAHQTANEGATATPAEKSGKQLKREQAAAVNALQSAFLSANLNKVVSVFLINGIRLIGKLRQFDQFCLLLEAPDGAKQLIFKHAVSTIAPPTRRPSPETDGNR